MADKQRYQLEIMWQGKWRRLFGADSRLPLDEYRATCPDSLEIRIVDTEEETEHGRRHRPGRD